ncbi:MAG: BofC C-terminal domain-containing protein [Paraclostridium sp.]
MFEKKKEFPWRIPIIILVGVLVLAGGIYVGLATTQKDEAKKEDVKITKSKEETKEVFELSENCEIWVEKVLEDGSISEDGPMMIGSIPNELIGKSKDQIVEYLTQKYPNRQVKNVDKYEITLVEQETFNDISRANKFSIEDNKGFICVYRYDKDGNRKLHENTQIETESLPKSVQDQVKSGIVVNSEDEVYSKLEDFGS